MTKDSRSLVPVSPDGLDEIAASLLEGNTTKPSSTSASTILPAINITSPENYIILTGKAHGAYSYPDLLVPFDRSYNNHNWNQARDAVHNEGSLILTIRQYTDFLKLLKSGNAFNGRGTKLESGRINSLLDDILTVRNPWRAEWLDAKFSNKGTIRKKLQITYNKIKPDGSLEEVTEPLQDCLMKDKTPGINLDYWLNNATVQGIPPKNQTDGTLYFWQPKDTAVAWFGADSDGVYLSCDWYPQFTNAGLGVRAAKIKR